MELDNAFSQAFANLNANLTASFGILFSVQEVSAGAVPADNYDSNKVGGRSKGRMVMGSPGESADQIEGLRAILDRLCAPDLTLSEAKTLVPNLSEFLQHATTNIDRQTVGTRRSMSNGQAQ